MVAIIEGNRVRILDSTGRHIRIVSCSSAVSSAYVNGNQVIVQLANGHGEIYGLNGNIIRRV